MKLNFMKKMTAFFCIVCCLSALFLSACASTPKDPRVSFGPGIGSDLTVYGINFSRNGANYPTCQLNIRNNTAYPYPIEWKTAWLDEGGMECDGVTNTWQKIAIQPREVKGVKNTSMSTQAKDVRIYIRKMQR